MFSSKCAFLVRFAASLATITPCVGCATTVALPRATLTAQSTPSLAIDDADHIREADAHGACAIDSAPRVIASKAAPPNGVQAESDSTNVLLSFARRADSRVVLALNPESLEVVDASDSQRFEEARFVRVHSVESNRMPSETAFAARVSWQAPVADAGESRPREVSTPVIVDVDSHRSVLAWTEGSAYTGVDVRIQTVGRGGVALGPPVTLAHEGSAIGRPTLAVTPSGRGVVAFLDSSEQGFELVAAPLNCTPLSPPVDPPSWASLIAQ